MTAFLVGLTGGLAAGKSTVAEQLARAGLETFDADRLVAELYGPGEAGTRRVEALFGNTLLRPDGSVNREALADRVFVNSGERQLLEAAIHPLVRETFASSVGEDDGLAVLEATLLVESGMADDFDVVVTVEADRDLRLERAVARGLPIDAARKRLQAQSGERIRILAADRVIRNDAGLENLQGQVDQLVDDLHLLSSRSDPGLDLLQGAVLVTGNVGKLEEARRLCGNQLGSLSLDLPEVQSLDLLEVLRIKGGEALTRFGRPIIVEETGLELESMNAFPGPLIKWMLQAVGPEGIAQAAEAFGAPTAIARCALLYLDGRREIFAEGETPGSLLATPRGDGGFGWDPVFVPDGEQVTYAQLTGEHKDRIGHRGRAWRHLLRKLRR